MTHVLFEMIKSFIRVGGFSFGGGSAMIPLLQREFVSLHGWLTSAQFLDVVAIAEMTPGPVAINAATFIGFRQAGFWGSAAATLAVAVPSIAIVWVLAAVTHRQANAGWLRAVFEALRPLVVALVAGAALTLAPQALPDGKSLLLMLVTLVAAARFRVHPIPLILISGMIGLLLF